jgi:hypothetical protein
MFCTNGAGEPCVKEEREPPCEKGPWELPPLTKEGWLLAYGTGGSWETLGPWVDSEGTRARWSRPERGIELLL